MVMRAATLWLLLGLGAVGPSSAVTSVTYTTDSNSGDCSSGSSTTCNLRAAVALQDGEPIHMASGTHTITEGEISVSADTKIYGDGDQLVTIEGSSNSDRLFSLSSSKTLNIKVSVVFA